MPVAPCKRRSIPDATPWPRLAGMVAVVLALGAAAALAGAQGKSDSAAVPTSTSSVAATALELQLEMAASDSFYLEIDPAAHMMRLRLAGVALREYPLLAVERGTPRLAFVPLGEALHMAGTAWSAGELDPPRPAVRMEMQPPDPNAPDSTLPVFQPPPSIEEMPVPSTYHIRYAGGLTLTVSSQRPAAAGFKGLADTVRDKFGAVREALGSRRAHLRLVLARADAQHLFRSMPPGTRLLVLPS